MITYKKVINFINFLYLYFKIIILYGLTEIFLFCIKTLGNNWFILFSLFNLPQNYIVTKKSYEYKNKKNNDIMLKYFRNNITIYNPQKFQIVLAWAIRNNDNNNCDDNKNNKNNNIQSKYILITNILHFIYLINKKLIMNDLRLILSKYNNITNIFIIFTYNNKLYVKIIDYTKKTYIDNTRITFNNIFYINNDSDSDSE